MPHHQYWTRAAIALREGTHDGALGPDGHRAFASWAAHRGLAGLLLRTVEGWPAPLAADLRAAARRQAVVAAMQEMELRRTVAQLTSVGISPLLVKGAALAYAIYPDMAVRSRRDTDMLIREQEAPRVRIALERLGYEPDVETSGRLVTSQFHYSRIDAHGFLHAVDVHLKISNAHAYANRLTFAELWADAVAVPRLSRDARAPSPVHALLIACIHRIAHHDDDDDLLWLLDIELLARSLDRRRWEQTLALAGEKQLCGVLLNGLERAQVVFGEAAPAEIAAGLRRAAGFEPPPPLLSPRQRRIVDVLVSDLGALPGWRTRLRLLREILFPPRSYMRQKYGRMPLPLLPLAYADRIGRGASRWLRRPSRLAGTAGGSTSGIGFSREAVPIGARLGGAGR